MRVYVDGSRFFTDETDVCTRRYPFFQTFPPTHHTIPGANRIKIFPRYEIATFIWTRSSRIPYHGRWLFERSTAWVRFRNARRSVRFRVINNSRYSTAQSCEWEVYISDTRVGPLSILVRGSIERQFRTLSFFAPARRTKNSRVFFVHGWPPPLFETLSGTVFRKKNCRRNARARAFLFRGTNYYFEEIWRSFANRYQ